MNDYKINKNVQKYFNTPNKQGWKFFNHPITLDSKLVFLEMDQWRFGFRDNHVGLC